MGLFNKIRNWLTGKGFSENEIKVESQQEIVREPKTIDSSNTLKVTEVSDLQKQLEREANQKKSVKN